MFSSMHCRNSCPYLVLAVALITEKIVVRHPSGYLNVLNNLEPNRSPCVKHCFLPHDSIRSSYYVYSYTLVTTITPSFTRFFEASRLSARTLVFCFTGANYPLLTMIVLMIGSLEGITTLSLRRWRGGIQIHFA